MTPYPENHHHSGERGYQSQRKNVIAWMHSMSLRCSPINVSLTPADFAEWDWTTDGARLGS